MAAGIALAGCGGSPDDDRADADLDAAAGLDERSADAGDPRGGKPVSRSDWAVVCATLARSERGYFDRLGDMRLYAIHEDGRWGIARSKRLRGS